MNNKSILGSIAAASAAMMISASPALASGHDKKIACVGVNACKGKGACKAGENGCKGKNSCKGKGATEMTEKECKDKHGTVK